MVIMWSAVAAGKQGVLEGSYRYGVSVPVALIPAAVGRLGYLAPVGTEHLTGIYVPTRETFLRTPDDTNYSGCFRADAPQRGMLTIGSALLPKQKGLRGKRAVT